MGRIFLKFLLVLGLFIFLMSPCRNLMAQSHVTEESLEKMVRKREFIKTNYPHLGNYTHAERIRREQMFIENSQAVNKSNIRDTPGKNTTQILQTGAKKTATSNVFFVRAFIPIILIIAVGFMTYRTIRE